MPINDNLNTGVLIGLSCARAIRPLEIIPGTEDDPYGVKTVLGWGIIGNVFSGNVNVISHNILVKNDVTKEGKSRCLFAFRTSIKEMSPLQILSTLEQDFADKYMNGTSSRHLLE